MEFEVDIVFKVVKRIHLNVKDDYEVEEFIDKIEEKEYSIDDFLEDDLFDGEVIDEFIDDITYNEIEE